MHGFCCKVCCAYQQPLLQFSFVLLLQWFPCHLTLKTLMGRRISVQFLWLVCLIALSHFVCSTELKVCWLNTCMSKNADLPKSFLLQCPVLLHLPWSLFCAFTAHLWLLVGRAVTHFTYEVCSDISKFVVADHWISWELTDTPVFRESLSLDLDAIWKLYLVTLVFPWPGFSERRLPVLHILT